MSSPTVGVLAMNHLGPQGGSGGPKVTLVVGGRRGSASSGILNNRRGSICSDTLVSGAENGEFSSGGRRGSDEGERRGGGNVHFADDKNSIFTSTSYAASRGLQRSPSPNLLPSGIEFPQPVAPPRAKGAAATLSSLFAPSAAKAPGIIKSSSEIFIPAPAVTPTKGILKSSSGILKTNNAGVPLSKSSSGGTLSTGNRVNFSDIVCNMNGDEPGLLSPPVTPEAPTGKGAKAPSSSSSSSSSASLSKVAVPQSLSATAVTANTPSDPAPLSSCSTATAPLTVGSPSGASSPVSGPPPPPSPPPVAPPRTRSQTNPPVCGSTGRVVTLQIDEKVSPTQQQVPQRRKPESQLHATPHPQAQYSQQKNSQPKANHHPQTKEASLQQQQQQQHKETQNAQHKEADRNAPPQQQVKLSQQKGERNDSRATSHGKFQQPKESDSQAILKLKQQNQQQLQQQQQQEAEKQEILKYQQQQRLQQQQQQQQQKSPKTKIIEIKIKREEYENDQQFQQLIRAGSLGSGESAAILQQRSRSPLPSPKRANHTNGLNEKQVITPVTVEATFNSSSERKICSFKSQECFASETSTECSKPTSRSSSHAGVRKSKETESISKGDSSSIASTTVAPLETRSGVIRAAAKAYTQNFQSYSYSSYLTKTRKDSLTSKEPSVTAKEAQEGSSDAKLPLNSKVTNNTSGSPDSPSLAATSSNSSVKTNAKTSTVKIVVPIPPFISSHDIKGSLASEDLKSSKTGTEKFISLKSLKKLDQSKENPENFGQKASNAKPSNSTVKSLVNKQDLQIHNTTTKPSVNQKELVKTTREKPINSSSNIAGSSPPSVKSGHTNTPAPPHKRDSKALPPLLLNLKSTLADKMKGSSEGALLVACRVAEEDQILRLLKELTATGTLDPAALNQTDRSGRTSLSYCCANAYLRIVESLTSMTGLDINKPDTDGNTPLHFASQAGHTEIVSHLVNKCNRTVDLDARNALGFTPLMKAALQGRTKIAKILLFAGASPHLRDFGRGLCAVEWARYTGRHICSELIDSVQKSCSSHIRDRWTSDPDLKSHSSTSLNTLGQGDNKDSWIKHKIKKAFHKSESKKEFSVVTNLSTMAVCATSPLLPTAVTQEAKPHQVVVPHVQITEVKVPDCYEDPEDALSQLPPPPPPPILVTEEPSPTKSPKKQSKNTGSSSSSPSPTPSSSSSNAPVVTTQESASSSSTASAAATASGSSTTPPAASAAASAAAASSSCASAVTSTTAASTCPSPSSSVVEETQGVGAEGGSGDAKSNGTAKSIVSSNKLPFSSNKKRK